MNKEQAINIVAQALSTVKATQQEHKVINEALTTLNGLVEAPVEDAPKAKKK
jgi:hypothetical protein